MQRPSKGSPAMARVGARPQVRLEAALDDAEERLVRPLVCAARQRSAQRWVRAVASATSARDEACGGTGWSRQTAMSAPSASWTAIACSGREAQRRPVEVRAERDAVLVDARAGRRG